MPYSNLGRNIESIEMHKQTLEVQERTLGPEHPDTLWSMHNLAVAYGNLWHNAEAAEMSSRSWRCGNGHCARSVLIRYRACITWQWHTATWGTMHT